MVIVKNLINVEKKCLIKLGNKKIGSENEKKRHFKKLKLSLECACENYPKRKFIKITLIYSSSGKHLERKG
jgi:hypothetical protein